MSMSSGMIERRSMTSASMPSFSTAASATCTSVPYATMVTAEPVAHDLRLPERHACSGPPAPRLSDARSSDTAGLLRVAIERPVVEPLRLEKDDRIALFDRGDQQPLRVVRIRRHHHLDAADMREQRLGTLRMRLPAADAAAAGHAHRRPAR